MVSELAADRSVSAVIRFDPSRRAADAALICAIRDLAGFLESREDRRRRRTGRERAAYSLAVEAVACNLVAAHMIQPGTGVVVERAHGTVFGHARYRPPVYGRHFIAVLDGMADANLLTLNRGFRVSERLRKPSTIRATAAFAGHLPIGRVDWTVLRRDDAQEVLILKGSKDRRGLAPLIDYDDTVTTTRLRRQVRGLNARLANAPIAVLATVDSHGRAIDPSRRAVSRSFSNGSWAEGGRLGGGWWTGMPRDDRFRYIRIEGERIATADYAQLYPRLLYALCGAEQPQGDLYDILGDGRWRSGWKRLVNSLLFARPPRLRNWPDDCRAHFGPNPPPLAAAITQIQDKHAQIAHYFSHASRIGFRLMKIESDMLLDTLDRLHRLRVCALPVHDAVLIGSRHAETARRVMQAAARKHAGITVPIVTLDFGQDVRAEHIGQTSRDE
jgi:hypothetical protein